MKKKVAWLLLGVISLTQAALLYGGFNGSITAVIVPLAAYLMGIVTKTAVDKVVNSRK